MESRLKITRLKRGDNKRSVLLQLHKLQKYESLLFPLRAVNADSKTKPRVLFWGFLSPLTEAALWCNADCVHFGAGEGEGGTERKSEMAGCEAIQWKGENPAGCGAAHSIRQPSK